MKIAYTGSASIGFKLPVMSYVSIYDGFRKERTTNAIPIMSRMAPFNSSQMPIIVSPVGLWADITSTISLSKQFFLKFPYNSSSKIIFFYTHFTFTIMR